MKSRHNSGAALLPVLLAVFAVVFVLLMVFVSWFFWAGTEVASAYSAKTIASGVFIAGRAPESLVSQELRLIPFLRYSVDKDAGTVTARVMGRHRKAAVYREGLGAAIAHDGAIEALRD